MFVAPLIFTSLVIIILTPFLWWFLLLRRYKELEKIPGPKPLPILGNALEFKELTPSGILHGMIDMQNKYGKIYKLHIGSEVKVLVSDPDLLEEILTSNVHIRKSPTYNQIRSWVGDGLLTSTGSKWKVRRKMLTPAFHFNILNKFIEIFNTDADTLIKNLEKEVGKESVDISPYINLFSLDVICETSLGVNYNFQNEQSHEYVNTVREFLEIAVRRGFSFWEKSDFLFNNFSPLYQKQEDALKILHKFATDVIKERRHEFELKRKQKKVTEEITTKQKVALLDMLLESEESANLTDDDIREELNTFTFEGHDTTTSHLTFFILALADNPEVQNHLYEEIRDVVGDNKNVTSHQLQEMKYFDMVQKEVMRYYPTVPLVERAIDTEFQLGEYIIPKNTTLTLWFYMLHHSDEYFPESNNFDPERFLPENQSKRHKFQYLPFSAGTRNCIGQRFALMESKVAIIKILQNYEILPVSGFKPLLGLTAVLKSQNGIKVALRKRKAYRN